MDLNFQLGSQTERLSEIEIADMAEDDMETRIWAQFVRKRGSEVNIKNPDATISNETKSQSTYTSSTKLKKADALIKSKDVSDKQSTFSGQTMGSGQTSYTGQNNKTQSVSGKTSSLVQSQSKTPKRQSDNFTFSS